MKKIHLRGYGDKNKEKSNRTFCGTVSKNPRKRLFLITGRLSEVTCDNCLRKLGLLNPKSRLTKEKENCYDYRSLC